MQTFWDDEGMTFGQWSDIEEGVTDCGRVGMIDVICFSGDESGRSDADTNDSSVSMSL